MNRFLSLSLVFAVATAFAQTPPPATPQAPDEPSRSELPELWR
jgi:hypothetical protein